MATTKQYALNLWRVHRTVLRKLGVETSWGAVDSRAPVVATDIMLAGLVKILTDKGLITDQELNAVYATIRNADFPQMQPVPAPGEEQENPDPDLGV